ncbi:hypothetical protein H4C81_25470 [Pseudomonas monteilii]|nr:hypothetical protein [Pseudomonas monteilii]MBA6092191.1 hypothetical protein [Pseudomonas monteilii]
MAGASVIHSNATNFQSFLQSGVDPRTGQYTLAIKLPTLAGNDLIGPQLPLQLAFSPLNDQDSGFGKGWSPMSSTLEIIHKYHIISAQISAWEKPF